ncbi:hypothetical protein Cflav_PD4434 [Pedosphaera parvula Ellin514]|uniref:Uncharacterized protein n=1 Tax=Pedosphaera parvula (strain Ellin514) TaxID=320771 RepID=B9XFP9_PEDPL|nr:hypothetical protein Cflav_PD4434 [Pedosphaera parvula Ellin514]
MLRGIEAWRLDGVVGRVREGDREARLETPHVVSYARERAWRWDWDCGARARMEAKLGGHRSPPYRAKRVVVISWRVFGSGR